MSNRILKRFCLVLSCIVTAFTLGAQVPILNSYIVSTPSRPVPTIYLDFDGHYIDSSSVWFGTANWQETVLEPAGLFPEQIVEAFDIVAEDFRPFRVNVTTDSLAFATAPIDRRIRVVITSSSEWYPGYYGGVAFLYSFAWGDDSYALVWSNNLGYEARYVAEAASHEAGHSFGLNHHNLYYDGTCEVQYEYHTGYHDGPEETTWAPIMGSGYYDNLVTWYFGDPCKGNVRNEDHDLKLIKEMILQKADDHPEQQPTVIENQSDSTLYISATGLIETRSDSDHFRFTIPSDMRVRIEATPEVERRAVSNLDLKLTLSKGSGSKKQLRVPGRLGVFLDTLLTAGEYNLFVSGDGDQFYTNYGSLGRYKFDIDNRIPSVKADLGPDTILCDAYFYFADAGNDELLNYGVEFLWSDGATSKTTYLTAGEQWLRVTDTRTGEVATDTIVIGYTEPIVPDFTFEQPLATCTRAVVKFNNLTRVMCGPEPRTVMWDFGDGTTSNERGDVSHEFPAPGTYQVLLYVERHGGDYNTISREVTIPVMSPPVVELGSTKSVCLNEFITITAATDASSAQKYIWNTGDTTNFIRINRTGTYWVKMTTKEGCTDSDTVRVVRSSGTLPDFDMQRTGVKTVSFTDRTRPCNSNAPVKSWYWNFGDGTTSTDRNPVHFYKQPGQYIISLTTANQFDTTTVYKDISVRYVNEIENYDGPVLSIPSRGRRVEFGGITVADVQTTTSTGTITIASTTAMKYQILTTSGQLLKAGNIVPGTNMISVSKLQKGIFFIALWNNEGKSVVRAMRR